jgi:DNA-binding transcriptional LysR family regulator
MLIYMTEPPGLGDVQLRHLAALAAVAREGSFGRAAQRLGYTQSAVSQQIAAFERVIGTPLFDRPRGPQPVTLTPAGELLLEHADAILGRLRAAEQDLARLLAGEGGRLAVGTFQSVSVQVLPDVVARLRAEAPAVEVSFVESESNTTLLDRLLDGTLDLTFYVGPSADPRTVYTELCLDPFVALVRRTGEPGEEGPLRVADLAGVPMVGQPENQCQYLIEDGLRARGVEPEIVFRSSDNGAVQAMVRAGMGAAVMPFLAVDPGDPDVVVRELDPPLAPRSIGILQRLDRALAPVGERFVALAREICADLHAGRGALAVR